MSKQSPYQILGVNESATQDEIKAAYRKLAKKFHPDLNPGNKEAESKFKEINGAYETVGTPEERAKFDRGETPEQQREAQNRGGGPHPHYYYETQKPGSRYSSNFEGFDPSAFEELFRQYQGQGHGPRRDPAHEDHLYSMEVDFNTSILGGEREITLPTGKKLKVKIPAGIKPGMKLRLANAEAGDTYIEINVQPSDTFKRVGNDLELEVPISLSEAVLGGEIKIPTVDGAVLLKIPQGLTTGSRVRVKGKGVPFKEGRGDQFVVVKVVLPSKIDPELESFMKQWSKTHEYNPREGR